MRYAKFISRLAIPIAVISVLLFIISGKLVSDLSVRSDFKEMLPGQAPSVIELNRIQSRVRGSDNLIILLGGENWPQLRTFVDSLVDELKTKLGTDLNKIQYNVTTVKNYYEHNKYLYIDLVDLKELHRRLKERIDWEKIKHTPFFLQFGDEEPKFETKDIEDKYRSKTGRYQDYHDGYFTTPEADLVAIMVWPREAATDVDFSKQFIEKVSNIIINTPGYSPELKWAFAGRIKKMITEYQAIIGDILTTTLLCVGLVGLVVLLYYRKIRFSFVILIAVAQGTILSLGLATVLIGYLTTQSAFLGSIIVGNGINYSLIFMARYIEERRKEVSVLDAISMAISQTWRPTFVAAIATSASFAALTMTHVRGFNQFGVIGGMGMLFCWISTYTVLPAWLWIFEHVWRVKMWTPSKSAIMERVSHAIIAKPSLLLKISIVFTAISVLAVAWYIPHSLEYDFSKLNFKAPKSEDTWEDKARGRLDDIFGESTSPSVIVLDNPDQGRPYCDAIIAKDPKDAYIESCKTLSTFVPKEQDEKLGVLADMRTLLSSSTLKFLTPEQLEEVNKFKDTFDLRKLTEKDVPDEVKEMFKDIDGNEGILAYVYPKADLWNGKELSKFADMLREVKLPDGNVVKASGQPVILADLLNTVVKEGPKATLISFFLVLLLILINFRNRWVASTVMATLLVGVLWLLGCMGILDVRLNFLNFVALPITFGIGVDYAVNILQRYRQDGRGSIGKVIANTGGAVVLCSLTTIIGYSVLLMSRSRALVSFGLVALFGEFTCLFAAILCLPAYVIWKERREEKNM